MADRLTNPAGFHPRLNPTRTNMNETEKQIVKLSLEAFKGFSKTTDVLVYHVIKCMADAVTRLHFTSVDHRMAIEDAVLTELEKKGVEVCY